MGKIAALLADYLRDDELAPGISLALLKDGKCVYQQSHGLANLENKVAINSRTAFYLASLTKSFTAAGISLLEKKGKFDLADSIRTV